ncbi:DUF1205 domain-containing protein [Actinocorallia sp. API 0066]|uniref:glycosyltransferase n=1 Tax=Actinocorallia sp. API 0066 TaxID=2896846 RepID=UPI001E56722F|nr:nucleotide disphospho-sugar-binding domain-containing protein [Actinocorallia sp. API 0066]MCD0452140.1 DUF1205 domain-containing protein [Actinocorallia sp. API 0066]
MEAGEGTIFPIVPLAQAVRGAGHEVLVAGHEGAMPIIAAAGLPGVPVTRREPASFRTDADGAFIPFPEDLDERERELGLTAARMAADALGGLLGLAAGWRPDLVIGGPLVYVAPLLAASVGVPWVRTTQDMGESLIRDRAAEDGLRPELAATGRDGLPAPALVLSLCPESIRPPDAPPAELMRHVSYATARTVEPWMYTRGERPRVLVSGGSRVSRRYALDDLRLLVHGAAGLDAELLIAAPADIVADLGPLPTGARAGWVPLDVVAATCDLAIHHGGGGLTLGCMAAAVPQVIVPFMPDLVGYPERLEDHGSAKCFRGRAATADAVATAGRLILDTPSYPEAAGRLREEMLGSPSPTATVPRLERLVAEHGGQAPRPASTVLR